MNKTTALVVVTVAIILMWVVAKPQPYKAAS